MIFPMIAADVRRPARPRPGRWAVQAAGSQLLLEARVCGMVGVQGRFTAVTGQVDIAADPRASSIRIDVGIASLTTGNARRDALLTAAGLIDPDAGPVIRFRSAALGWTGAAGWVDGVVCTARDARLVRLALDAPLVDGERMRVRARGRIGRDDIDGLLARPGCARLMGPTAELDLTVELAPVEP